MEHATDQLLLVVRLAVAALLAGVLGFERQQAGKAAGLRTHMLVGIAAALFMALGEAMPGRTGDPLRTVQAVATGVGFLGAGAIFFQSAERRVHGLTTAASIWATSSVGIAAGAGVYVLAAGATVLLVGVLRGLRWVEVRLEDGRLLGDTPTDHRS
ncbi:MAG: MgtC/SapB family protein [Bacteroidetes bacterium]|nr:MgtC/SapB family protein [Bacteroidota bacterium]